MCSLTQQIGTRTRTEVSLPLIRSNCSSNPLIRGVQLRELSFPGVRPCPYVECFTKRESNPALFLEEGSSKGSFSALEHHVSTLQCFEVTIQSGLIITRKLVGSQVIATKNRPKGGLLFKCIVLAASYSPLHKGTIASTGLNCRVRNENGCGPRDEPPRQYIQCG